MKNLFNRKFILLTILIATLFSISAVSAVDNITVDGDSVVEGEVEMPTERLEIKFNDNDETFTFNVFDERLSSGLTDDLNYDYKVNNKTCSSGQGSIYSTSAIIPYRHDIKYYEDGEHNLKIYDYNHGTNTLLFDVDFKVENNVSLSDDITIQHTKTVKYSIKNGVLSGSFPEQYRTLHEGWNNLTEYSILNTGLGTTKPVILKVFYRPYMINNTDIRTLTEMEENSDDENYDDFDDFDDYDDDQKIKIMADDIDLYYSTAYGYIVSLVDQYGSSVDDVDELKVIYDDGQEEIGEYDDDGIFLFNMDTIGNRKATIILSDSYYVADPVTINVKISKSPVKITTKTYYSNTKQYSILKAIVKDTDGEPIEEGKVKFDINGKSYYANVKNGVATKKIKLTKAKTYTYSATYLENDHYKGSKVSYSKIYVYSSSKNARTFRLNGYKFTLNQYQYNKLINAKNTGKTVSYTIKTNKKVKQTITYTHKNYRTIKAFAYAYISYGGKEPQGQRQSPNKYSIFVETKYTAYVTKGKLILTKQATTIDGLKNAKVSDMSHFSMK